MRPLLIITTLLGWVTSVVSTDNGLTDLVAWDSYSLSVNGERVFINSAEFHYQRLPVPELWLDIFHRLKANGFNTVSVYFFWSYHSASKGVFDFESPGKDIQQLFDYAKEAGLWVVARAGPYCNAETNGGGLALWGSDGSLGNLRTSDETYHQAWIPWVQKIGSIIAANQITNGGPVILNQVENELSETVHSADNTLVKYMEQLKTAFRDAGIVVPFTHNEKGMRAQSWSTDYQDVGGSVNVYKNNIGQRVTLQNFYMTYGGTNWGHSAAPVVYTSYDYSAPLRETRQQWDKLFQTKLVNFFASSSPDLLKTDMVGNGTGYQVSSSSIFTWVLRNPDTDATFTVAQQSSTKSTENVTFSATLNTSAGSVTVADVSLLGRQSRILVTDYTFGNHTLLYSSADVATWATFDEADAIVLYLKEGQTGHLAFKGEPGLTYDIHGSSAFSSSNSTAAGQAFTYVQGSGATFVKFSNGVLVYLLDQPTAWTFWAPSTAAEVYRSPGEKVFVLGPYLVRSASISGDTLHISGDNDIATTLEAFVGAAPLTSIVWNGQELSASKTAYGTYTADIPGTESRAVSLPSLDSWTSADSLPEAQPDFDDSAWIACNKTSSPSPIKPYTLPVLFSSDYGYYTGAKIYRGYFSGSNFTSVNISASGGLAFGWNAWLNGLLIGGDQGNASLPTTTQVLDLPLSALQKSNGTNVLTVVVDYHGHDQTSTAKGVENPRGILGAQLLPGTTTTDTGFTLWKIQGNAGGSANIDAVRGPMNEGGLYGERLGWHLPGFSPESYPSSLGAWDDSTPLDGLSTSGIRFYISSFKLDIAEDLDAPLGLSFSSPAGTVARVMFWINGYQYGKYEPHIGPQTVFPVPPGIINNQGDNTIAVSIWAQTDDGARLDEVKLVSYGLYQTDYGFSRDWSALQPGWTDRSEYI
ncbi:hypothetical protein Daus18300_001226 [Diaporthe australafricana]|uniref:beta-galactosidase n=1 Tax=Diaporthe australafricana TaxID=127596 RepID=A0ABR3XX76_9PEZI